MKKRIISFLTALTLAATSLGIVSTAEYKSDIAENVKQSANSVSGITNFSSSVYVNPIYKNSINEKALKNESKQSKTEVINKFHCQYVFNNFYDASAYVKENMKDRNENISIKLSSKAYNEIKKSTYYKNNEDEYIESNKLIEAIVDKATEHNGNPKEGDYIKWQFQYGDTAKFNNAQGQVCLLFSPVYSTDAKQEEEVDAEVKNVLNKLNLKGKNQYEKLETIYKYITDNVEYDYENLENGDPFYIHSCHSAIVKKATVCQGYALMLYRLLLEEGIDNRLIVSEDDEEGISHAWNIVHMGDKYYICDSTWDAGASTVDDYMYYLIGTDTVEDIDATVFHTFRDKSFLTRYPVSTDEYVYQNKENAYTDWVTTKNPTCSKEGVQERTCTTTGKKETRTIPAMGNKIYSKWTIDKAPTCTQNGQKSHHCENCGEKADVTILPATGHDYEVTTVKPTYTSRGYNLHKCTVCGHSYKDNYTAALKRNLSKATVTGVKTAYYYTGKKIVPKIIVKYGNTLLKLNKDYTVTYTSNLLPGKASVTITGKGSFTGKVTKTFTIKIPAGKIAAIKGEKKAFLVTCAKCSSASGYLVQYADNSKFKNAGKCPLYNSKNTILREEAVKSGKIYYVKVINFVKSGSKTYFGAWSNPVKVRIK